MSSIGTASEAPQISIDYDAGENYLRAKEARDVFMEALTSDPESVQLALLTEMYDAGAEPAVSDPATPSYHSRWVDLYRQQIGTLFGLTRNGMSLRFDARTQYDLLHDREFLQFDKDIKHGVEREGLSGEQLYAAQRKLAASALSVVARRQIKLEQHR